MSVRDTIKKRKPKVVEISLPGGDTVWVKSLSGEERNEFRAMVEKAKGNGGLKAEAITAIALCEKDGTRVYDYKNDADLKDIKDMEGSDVDFICMKFLSASGLSEQAVETLQKNSEAIPNG